MTGILEAALPCAAAFAVVYLATPRLASLLESRGMTVPDGHKRGRVMVAMPGGPAIFAGLAAAFLVLHALAPSGAALAALLTSAAAFAIGLADDRRPMPGWFKPVTLAAAALPLLLAGPYDTDLHFPPFGDVRIPVLYPALLVMMVVVTGNAANSIDVLNGVLSGFMAIAGAALAASLYIVGRPDVAAAALPLVAASLAYYRYHRLPSRIFPGDSGALALGAAYGALAIAGGVEVVAAIAFLPAIANSFFFLSSTGRIVEFRRTRAPVEMTGDGEVRLRPTRDRLAPVTLVRLILAPGPLTESGVARRIFALAAFSGALAVATALLGVAAA